MLSANIKSSEIYWYKNRPYKILYESKIKNFGEWTPITVYMCLYDNEHGMIWARETIDFDRMFTTKRPENPYFGPKAKSLT